MFMDFSLVFSFYLSKDASVHQLMNSLLITDAFVEDIMFEEEPSLHAFKQRLVHN